MVKDNIDMNARSTFVKSHYHGASLSIAQFPTNKNPGINLGDGLLSEQSKKNSKKLSPLPAEYVNIKKLFTLPGNPDKRLWTPLCYTKFKDMLNFPNFDVGLAWLCNVQQLFSTYAEDTEYPGWAKYHSHFICGPKQPPGINTIFPIIPDKVNTLQTQGYCMTLNINSTRTLNPTQTAIDLSDKAVYCAYQRAVSLSVSLFSITIQYRYPHLIEKYYSIMRGGPAY